MVNHFTYNFYKFLLALKFIWFLFRITKNFFDEITQTFPVYDKNDFKEVTQVKFEDIHVNVPKNYDKILTELYGDYMQLPPEDKRYNHPIDFIDFGKY